MKNENWFAEFHAGDKLLRDGVVPLIEELQDASVLLGTPRLDTRLKVIRDMLTNASDMMRNAVTNKINGDADAITESTINHPKTCFECGEGHYVEMVENYRRAIPDGETLIVPRLLILRCDKCGEETIPPESSRRIETAMNDTFRAFLGKESDQEYQECICEPIDSGKPHDPDCRVHAG